MPNARNSPAELNAILDAPLTDAQAVAYLSTAATLLNAAVPSGALSSAQLRDVEKYLAAHFSSVAKIRPGLQAESLHDHSMTFGSPFSESEVLGMLGSTAHGRAAMALDTSGTLAEVGKPRTTFRAL
ncbi:MAG: hypothetical protein R3349_03900 [Geminicoccaceae bacterium]|nr:hypothetical protein [Geminicoccaceae bacterium]